MELYKLTTYCAVRLRAADDSQAQQQCTVINLTPHNNTVSINN